MNRFYISSPVDIDVIVTLSKADEYVVKVRLGEVIAEEEYCKELAEQYGATCVHNELAECYELRFKATHADLAEVLKKVDELLTQVLDRLQYVADELISLKAKYEK